MNRVLFVALAAGGITLSASAQVVLNEIFPNPPGGGTTDDRWEYIEIQGPAGMDLSGYMIASVYGGADGNANDIPGPLPGGWDLGDEVPEIDEAWTLDGLHLGANGFLVLYNNNGAAAGRPSFIPALLPATTERATFATQHIPSTDVAGRIKNDGSATFILLRKRPNHSLDASGLSLYADGYAWRKDVDPDVDFDGQVDFGGVGTLLAGGARPPETPVNSENAATPAVGPALVLEAYQMVDDVAWSNGGGKEYTRSKQQEISDTSGFNPDAASRVAYYGVNPARGNVFSGGQMSTSHMADEEWMYGDIPAVPSLVFDPILSGGPTDPSGQHYNAQGQPDAAGEYLLDDVNRTGFKLTPGTFNDVDATAAGGIITVQARFVRGDFNFDGVVDCSDRALIAAAVGAGLDDTHTVIDHNGTPDDASDDFTLTRWTYEGRGFNALLAMVRMSLTDGTTGEWNSGVTVTPADLAAFDAQFPLNCNTCPADFNADGFLDFFDADAYVSCFEGLECPPGKDADFNGDQFVDFFDLDAFVEAFEQGC